MLLISKLMKLGGRMEHNFSEPNETKKVMPHFGL